MVFKQDGVASWGLFADKALKTSGRQLEDSGIGPKTGLVLCGGVPSPPCIGQQSSCPCSAANSLWCSGQLS